MIVNLLEIEKEGLNLRKIYKVFNRGEAEKEQKLEEEMIVKRKREEVDITLPEGATLADVDDL